MRRIAVVPFAGGLFLAASSLVLVACGGSAGGPEAPNPPGVPDTVVFAVQSAEVIIGDTLRLSVVARDAGGNVVPDVVLVWRSLTPSVATVSADGLVTALDIGEAEIEVEATVPGSSMAILVDSSRIGTTSLRRVRSAFKMLSVPNVAISPGAATVAVRDKKLFTARITNLNNQLLANRPDVKWSSSNPAVATIDVTGLATAIAKGATTITATVTVGASSGVTKTATLTVTEALCSGIALVPELRGQVFYDYAVAGTIGDNRISSEYHGQVNATMTNVGWEPEIPTVVWAGPLGGAATQVETVHDRTGKETQRLEGAGPVIPGPQAALSRMSVVVDLRTCTYTALVDVSIDLTWTLNGKQSPIGEESARIRVGAGKALELATGLANPFPFIDEEEFPGHLLAFEALHQDQDSFIPHGIAAQLIAQGGIQSALGNAKVSYGITVVKP